MTVSSLNTGTIFRSSPDGTKTYPPNISRGAIHPQVELKGYRPGVPSSKMFHMDTIHQAKIDNVTQILEGLIRRFSYFPESSIVISWLISGKEVLAQRVDLADPTEDIAPSWVDEVVAPGVRVGADAARLFVFTDHSELTTFVSTDLILGCENVNIAVETLTHVTQDRILAVDCTVRCAHSFETLVSVNRRDLVSLVAKSSEEELLIDEIEFYDQDLLQWRISESENLLEFLHHQRNLSVADMTRIVRALSDFRIRDTFLWDAISSQGKIAEKTSQLTNVLPRVPLTHIAPIATVVGICWWLQGQGTMANICIDRAFEGDPHYSLATMIRTALNFGVSPEFWMETVGGLTRSECLVGTQVAAFVN